MEGEKDLETIIDTSPLEKGAIDNLYSHNKGDSSNTSSKKTLIAIDATGTLYVPPTTLCRFDGNKEFMNATNLFFSEINDSESEIYNLRDNELFNGERGMLYINAYYEISNLLEDGNYDLSELTKLTTALPNMIQKYNDLKDPNYTGVIVNQELIDDVTEIANFYKTKGTSDNTRYQSLIDAVVADLNSLKNKDRNQVLEFLQN